MKADIETLKKSKVAMNKDKINEVWGPNTREQFKR